MKIQNKYNCTIVPAFRDVCQIKAITYKRHRFPANIKNTHIKLKQTFLDSQSLGIKGFLTTQPSYVVVEIRIGSFKLNWQ